MGEAIESRPLAGYLGPEINVMMIEDAPQIHIHILTDDLEGKKESRFLVELCCHSCGTSLICCMADPNKEYRKFSVVREDFIDTHKTCEDYGFAVWCPDIRSSSQFRDFKKEEKYDIRIRRNKALTNLTKDE